MRVLVRSLVVCALLVAPLVALEGAAPSLRGTVIDPAGGALPGVTVELKAGDRVAATLVTDADGRFVIEDVAPGDYVLVATLAGFTTFTRNVHVFEGTGLAPIQIRMELGSVSESVNVTAGSPVLDTKRSMMGTRGRDRAAIVVTPSRSFSTATYDPITDNGFKRVADAPLSTFSVDVDTASYSNVRRFLNAGSLPPADAVRIEELINYFHFDYPEAQDRTPMSVTAEVGSCPWNDKHRLALIGLQTRRLPPSRTPPRNLVFLLDVSGRWNRPSACRWSKPQC